MPDMLVHLLKLPELEPEFDKLRKNGIVMRRPLPHEMGRVRAFVESTFGVTWADEISVGYANKPVTIYVAIEDGEIVGFGAYEVTRRGFFGPTGVHESQRGKGIGRALLIACLWGLYEMGYVYAIIGAAGPTEFYQKTVGALVIEDSTPGIFADPLKRLPADE